MDLYQNKKNILKVKQRIIKELITESFSEPATKICDTNETAVNHIDNTWSFDSIDIFAYGTKTIDKEIKKMFICEF